MKKFFSRNIKLKIFAIGFSVALWFFVAGQRDSEIGFMVPLGFKGVPKDMVMTSAPPGEVEIRVAGPKLIISNLSPLQIITELDMSSAREGRNTYRLREDDVDTPMGVKTTRIKPATFDIRMERIVSVKVPVKPVITGKPAKGFKVTGTTVTPDMVAISGLARDVKNLTEVKTEKIDIDGSEQTRLMTVVLSLPEKEFRKLGTGNATVRVIIEKEMKKK